MEQETKTTRSLAIEWFNSFSSLGKTALCDNHTEIIGEVRRWETLTGREIEHIYLSENPQTETEDVFKTKSYQQEPKVEDVQVRGLPDKLDVHSTGLFPMKAELHPINDPDGLIILADVQTMELANEIVKRYNNFDAMYSALKDLIEVATNTTANLVGFDGADELDNSIDKAKAIINNIQ